MKLARAVAVTLCLAQFGVLLGACSASHKAARPNPGSSASTTPAAGTLVILASTQLKPAFDRLEIQFAAASPGVSATATYQGSQALATAVLSGNADAGIAFQSDVVAGGSGVTGVALPAGNPVEETYRIGVLRNAANPAAASAFVQFVRSERGRAILAAAGFVPAG